jgi:excisionase family DNA binding protein
MLSQPQADPSKSLLHVLNDAASEECLRLNSQEYTLDIQFLAFLRSTSQFGFFSFGPVHIDVRLIEDIVERTTPRRLTPHEGPPPYSDDYVRFSQRLIDEARRSGRSRIDELHFLLAFMRTREGLPGRVFGELGVTPEQVEQFARDRGAQPAPMEKLYSPEEAAEYFHVHVQTVRGWVKSGRLKACRLAGQRALRITASDLMAVLEPADPNELD